MTLDSGFTDEENCRELLVALAASQECEHLQFAAGQGFTTHACGQFLNQRRRDAGFTAMNLADALQHVLASRVLEQITFRSCSDSAIDFIVSIVGLQDDESSSGFLLATVSADGYAVKHRH